MNEEILIISFILIIILLIIISVVYYTSTTTSSIPIPTTTSTPIPTVSSTPTTVLTTTSTPISTTVPTTVSITTSASIPTTTSTSTITSTSTTTTSSPTTTTGIPQITCEKGSSLKKLTQNHTCIEPFYAYYNKNLCIYKEDSINSGTFACVPDTTDSQDTEINCIQGSTKTVLTMAHMCDEYLYSLYNKECEISNVLKSGSTVCVPDTISINYAKDTTKINNIGYNKVCDILFINRLLFGMNPDSWETNIIRSYLNNKYNILEISQVLLIFQEYINWLNKELSINIYSYPITNNKTTTLNEIYNNDIRITIISTIIYFYTINYNVPNIIINKLWGFMGAFNGLIVSTNLKINKVAALINKSNTKEIVCSDVALLINRGTNIINKNYIIGNIYFPMNNKIATVLEFEDLFKNLNNWVIRDNYLKTRFKENVYIDSQGMHQKILKNIKYPEKIWSAGEIYTNDSLNNKRTFGYGYYEASIKYATVSGINNAFWLTSSWPYTDTDEGTDRLDEIDINEGHSIDTLTMTHHRWLDNYKFDYRTTKTILTTNNDLSKDYHMYGLLFTPNKLEWYLDNNVVKSFDIKITKPNVRVKFSTNVIIQAGKITDSVENAHMDVQFFRYYTLI